MTNQSNITEKKPRTNSKRPRQFNAKVSEAVSGDTAPVTALDEASLEVDETSTTKGTPRGIEAPTIPSVTVEATPAASGKVRRATVESSILKPSAITATPAPVSVYTDIVSFLRVLIINSWIIILLGGIGGAGAYFYAKSQPRIFQSTTTLMVVPEGKEELRVQAGTIDSLRANLVGNYVQVLRSRDRTIDPTLEILNAKYEPKLVNKAEIDIIPVSNSTVITVVVNSEDKELAQEMADTLADQAIKNSPPQFASVYPMEVLDKATIPDEPVSPQIRLVTIMGAAGFAAVGVALAFFLDGYVRFRRSKKAALSRAV